MRHGVDHGFEQRLVAVLRHIHARRLLARRDPHIADREGHRVGDLPVQRPGNLLRVDLAGSAIPSPVPGRGDARITQPLFGIPGAQQQAGRRRAHDAVFVGRQKREFLERRLGIRCALGAQQRFPELFVQCSEPRVRYGLFVEPMRPGLSPPLRQARPLVGAHRALRSAHPDVASSRAVMPPIASGDFEKQDSLAAGELLAPAANAHGRLDGVGAYLDQEGIQGVDLFAGHALRRSVVVDAAEHDAAIGIGERRDLVGPIVPFRALRPVAGELDPFELPTAVLAQPQLALNIRDAEYLPRFLNPRQRPTPSIGGGRAETSRAHPGPPGGRQAASRVGRARRSPGAADAAWRAVRRRSPECCR